MQPISRKLGAIAFVVLITTAPTRGGDVGYYQTNLVSNIRGLAEVTDPNLQGAWGMSASTTSPWWISDQASDKSTLYKVNVTPPVVQGLVVGIPNQGGAPANPNADGPTGQVATGAAGVVTQSSDFQVNGGEAHFIFANMDGSISAWRTGASATITTNVAGASFTGLAIANLPNGGAAQIYAADQASGNIDVFNSHWQMTGSFKDPNFATFPTGYAAFNVQTLNVNGTPTLFVTYANQSTGGGIVDEFSTSGQYITTLINDTAGAHLNSPWGLAIAPAGWGKFGGDLLVANNNPDSNGMTGISAYTLTGQYVGSLTLNTGQQFSATELWALCFGNGGSAGSPDTLYFTAGLDGNLNGLIGAISLVPEPNSAVLGLIAAGIGAGAWQWKQHRRRRASA
jgi:uncharacterized protein (TIGR03118 family)